MRAVLLGVAGCALGIARYFLTRKWKYVITPTNSSRISFSLSGISLG